MLPFCGANQVEDEMKFHYKPAVLGNMKTSDVGSNMAKLKTDQLKGLLKKRTTTGIRSSVEGFMLQIFSWL